MKTTAECYQALLDGETLVSPEGAKVKLHNNTLYHFEINEHAFLDFSLPDRWQIYRAPEWWEKIKEPVLCYVHDNTLNFPSLRFIVKKSISVSHTDTAFIDTCDVPWAHATPVPKEELLKMIAALEAVEGEA